MCGFSQDSDAAIYWHFIFLTALNTEKKTPAFPVSLLKNPRQKEWAGEVAWFYSELTPLTPEISNLKAEVKAWAPQVMKISKICQLRDTLPSMAS